MRDAKIIVSEVVYGNESIQKLTEQMIELLIHSRYTLNTPNFKQAVHSLTKPVGERKL